MLRVHFISVIFIVINNVSIVYFYFHIAVYFLAFFFILISYVYYCTIFIINI